MRSALPAALAAASILALQVAGKATRDALFLAAQPASALPAAALAAAVASLGAALVVSRAMVRRGPHRVAPRLLAGATVGYLLLALLHPAAPRAAAWLLVLHTGVVGPVAISAFWSVVTEAFDPRRARRAIGFIAAGATAGGLVGGLAAEGTARLLGPEGLLPALVGLAAVATAVTGRFARTSSFAAPAAPAPAVGSEGARYLRTILALVVVLAVAGTALDLVMKIRIGQAFPPDHLPPLFARFYAALGLATFAVQSLVTGRLLRHAGLALALAALPLALLFGAGGALLVAGALPVLVARGSASVCESSLFRSSYELLFAPVAPRHRRATKVLVDVGAVRLGDALGSGALVLAATGLPLIWVDRLGLTLAALAGAVALALAARVRRAHLALLAARVRSGAARLGPEPPLRVATDPALEALLALLPGLPAGRACRRALLEGEGPLRACALEYLELATRGAERRLLQDALGGLGSHERRRRESIADELLGSLRSLGGSGALPGSVRS